MLGTYCIHNQSILVASIPLPGGINSSDDEDDERSAGLGLPKFGRASRGAPTTQQMIAQLPSSASNAPTESKYLYIFCSNDGLCECAGEVAV